MDAFCEKKNIAHVILVNLFILLKHNTMKAILFYSLCCVTRIMKINETVAISCPAMWLMPALIEYYQHKGDGIACHNRSV